MADKAMKSLEEVIKYKLNFLSKGIDPFFIIPTSLTDRGLVQNPYKNIYETKNTIFYNDSLSLMEGITPLFIYISSCDKYYREKSIIKIIKIDLLLFMGNFDGVIEFRWPFLKEELGEVEHRISIIKRYYYDVHSKQGYFNRFTKPFTMIIKGYFKPCLTHEEIIQIHREIDQEAFDARYNHSERRDSGDEEASQSYSDDSGDEEASQSYSDDSDDEEKEELSINDFKTFKSDQCVICLEEEPKVLFCNCGHLCICEKCLVRRHDDCPVCKKETTILRIIE